MQTVERIGYERFKYGFSYNFGWDMKTGMFGCGMPLAAKGTHTVNVKRIPGFSYDQNAVAIAIAAVGNPGDTVTPRAKRRLVKFIVALIEAGALTETFDIMPHSAFAAKDCPTDAVRNIMVGVRNEALLDVKRRRQARSK